MKFARFLIAAALAVLFLTPGQAPATAAPAAQGANLLANPGFETAGSTGSGSANWLPWWAESAKPSDGSFNYAFRPQWNQESLSAGASSAFVFAGNSAQRVINNWDPWFAGVKQVVTAPAGATVRLTVYTRVWVASAGWPTPSDTAAQVRMQVGLDPNGGDNQFAGGIAWSGAAAPYDTWQAVSVQTTVGAGGKVGVFLSADYRGTSRQWLAAFFDEATLVVVDAAPAPVPTSSGSGQPAPTSPPAAPVATAVPFVMPTAGPDGNIVYVVKSGDTGWGIAANARISLDQLSALNGGINLNVLTVGQRLVIGQGAPSVAPTNTPAPTATVDPNAAPTEAAPPTPSAAETPGAQATAVASANTGKLCATIYEDVNGNALREETEGAVSGGNLTLIEAATGAPVQSYITQPGEVQHCFENIAPGVYTLAAAPPSGYNATTSANARLEVQAGASVNIEFGAQQGSGGGTTTAPGGEDSRLRTALFGAAGIMLILLAAGIAGFLVLRRR